MMLNKADILEELERERLFAVEINEPIMALGISQAIQTIRNMKEEN